MGNMSAHYESEESLNRDDALMSYNALIFFFDEAATLIHDNQ